jgi:hypothetical protein
MPAEPPEAGGQLRVRAKVVDRASILSGRAQAAQLPGGRPSDAGAFAGGQGADDEEGDAVGGAWAVGAAWLTADYRAGSEVRYWSIKVPLST